MTSSSLQKTALGHIRVLDLTRVLAGPVVRAKPGRTWGAEVIKVERDPRQWRRYP